MFCGDFTNQMCFSQPKCHHPDVFFFHRNKTLRNNISGAIGLYGIDLLKIYIDIEPLKPL